MRKLTISFPHNNAFVLDFVSNNAYAQLERCDLGSSECSDLTQRRGQKPGYEDRLHVSLPTNCMQNLAGLGIINSYVGVLPEPRHPTPGTCWLTYVAQRDLTAAR